MEIIHKPNTMWSAIIVYENEITCNSSGATDYKMCTNISQKRQRYISYEVEDAVTLMETPDYIVTLPPKNVPFSCANAGLSLVPCFLQMKMCDSKTLLFEEEEIPTLLQLAHAHTTTLCAQHDIVLRIKHVQ